MLEDRELTTTSYAILGMLAIQPWSTYALTQQMRRSLRHLWLKYHPPLEVRTKHSRRLAKRLRENQALRFQSRSPKRPRSRDHH